MVKFKEHLRRRLVRMLPALCAALCVVLGFGCALGWIWCTQRVVTFTDTDGLSLVRVSGASEPNKLLREAGLTLGQYDLMQISNENGTERIHILRGWAVDVLADGEICALRMEGGTVEQALDEAGVSLNGDDYTEPSIGEPVRHGMTVTVHRVEYKEFEREETVEPQLVEVPSSLFYRQPDSVVVRQEPQAGTVLRSYRQRYVDGEPESEEVTAEEVITPVQDEIVAVYGEKMPVSSLEGPDIVDGAPEEYTTVFTGKATGYSASPTARGASGRHLSYGTCAVNPALIPYGTKVYVTSTDGRFVYGYAIAADTGTAMMSGDVLIDLYYETYAESVANAVIQVNVYVVND